MRKLLAQVTGLFCGKEIYMHPEVIGGIVGGVLGVAGGIFGTYCSIKNTNSSRERAFMIRACVIGWIAILVFLGLMFALPNPYRYFLWIPYAILLPLAIVTGNRSQQRIRQEESQNNSMQATPNGAPD
jgi:uncharacterized membrane protein YfcA